jgi:hypothetical protein
MGCAGTKKDSCKNPLTKIDFVVKFDNVKSPHRLGMLQFFSLQQNAIDCFFLLPTMMEGRECQFAHTGARSLLFTLRPRREMLVETLSN